MYSGDKSISDNIFYRPFPDYYHNSCDYSGGGTFANSGNMVDLWLTNLDRTPAIGHIFNLVISGPVAHNYHIDCRTIGCILFSAGQRLYCH
ncbi:MAG: hypothetical protein WC022_01460 [Parcubacteria group bacterium]